MRYTSRVLTSSSLPADVVQPIREEGSISTTIGSSQSGVMFREPNQVPGERGGIERQKSTEGIERQGKYKLFRRHCDELRLEIEKLDDFMTKGFVSDEGLEVVVEIEYLLEKLYDCPSEGEGLRKIVVLLQSQVLNTRWSEKHVRFMRDAVHMLRISYLLNDDLVEEVFDLIGQVGLDQFRGTVTETEVRKTYRIQEVE